MHVEFRGYINDAEGKLVIDKKEAKNVQMIFNLYLQGKSVLGIVKELERLEIKSPTGKEKWAKRTIDVMLSNEKYTGNVRLLDDGKHDLYYLSEDNKITYYKNITKVWNDLEKGTIDATIYDTTGIQNYMKEHADNTNLSVLNEQLNSEESNYGIMFVKEYKYLDQFNVALQVLNNDGTYQKLKEQWIKTKE